MDLINPLVRRWLDAATADPDGFWAAAAELALAPQVGPRLGMGLPDLPLVRRRPDQPGLQLPRPPCRPRPGRARRADLPQRARRAALFTYAQLLRRGGAARGGPARPGHRAGRPDHHLHADLPRGDHADAAPAPAIGAIHSVVFAGFGAGALGDRIRASGSRLVFTADITYRKGKDVPLKGIVDEALRRTAPTVEQVIVCRRGGADPPMTDGRDVAWDEFLQRATGQDGGHVAHGGERAGLHPGDLRHDGQAQAGRPHPRRLPGPHPRDGPLVLRAAARRRLVVDLGHRLGRRPQLHRLRARCCTAARRSPTRARSTIPTPRPLWRVIEEFGVTGAVHLAHGGAAADALRRGARRARYDLSSLERVFCAGEVLNAAGLGVAAEDRCSHDRVPVIDHMWQTETGGPVFGNPYGIALLPIKPGSAGIPLPGHRGGGASTPDGEPLRARREGHHGRSRGRSPA